MKSSLLSSIALVSMAVALSCGDANPKATFDPVEGHPSGWVNAHGGTFLSDPEQCSECHGNDLQGGVSDLSCFSRGFDGVSCHGASAFHGTGWPDPVFHGTDTKAAPDGSTGFASCQACHGSGFAGGAIKISCFAAECHGVPAPHSPAPWRIPLSAKTHTDTDEQNASVCAECHRDESGANVPLTTPAGCFNNTLCHATASAHPTGWAEAAQHGAAAKAALGADTGFATCQSCHGADFKGGITSTSCFICHVNSPHSPAPWRIPLSAKTHTDTDEQNASVCAECHRDESGANVPLTTPAGCFNNTLCHAEPAAHPAAPSSWTTDHSLDARVDNTGCGVTSCHGADFAGGASEVSCFECHLAGPDPGAGIMHPNRWPDPEKDHENFLKNLDKNATSCSPTRSGAAQYCHGEGLPDNPALITAPPNGSWPLGPTCFACHEKVWTLP